jgi:Tfp pilus assembly protein PilN
VNRVTLNLATHPFRNNSIVGTVLAAVVAATIGATVYNGYVYTNYGGRFHGLEQEEKQQRERLQALETDERRLSKEIAAHDFKRLYGRGQFAADLILKRAFSWTLLFNKLESLMPPDVMMTAIRPHISSEGIDIRVEGIAKNHGALIALEDSLLKNTHFTRVYPASERRLNPSRPEITFVMQFDYVSSKGIPGPEAVADASPAPSPGGPAAQAAAASASPTPPAAALASVATKDAPPVPVAAAPADKGPVLGTVGRDGRPRTPELLAQVMAAPGGFYPEAPAPLEPPSAGKKPKTGQRGNARPAGEPAVPAAPSRTTGAAGGPSAPAGSRQAAGSQVSAVSLPTGPVLPTARPPLVPGLPARRDPNRGVPRKEQRPQPAPPLQAEPIPATRLDTSLRFSARPVGDVYAALSRAHGVRFDIDPSVDAKAPVSVDLAGKNLKDAIAVLSKATGHRVVRVRDGVYRVVLLAGGEPLSDRPLQEEPLQSAEPRP